MNNSTHAVNCICLLCEERRGSGGDMASLPTTGAVKLDGGKSPAMRGMAAYFPNALLAVADVSRFGYVKYGEWGGWRKVDDAIPRYADAMMRHLLARASGEMFDQESKLRHAAQLAWNALALLELELQNARSEPVS